MDIYNKIYDTYKNINIKVHDYYDLLNLYKVLIIYGENSIELDKKQENYYNDKLSNVYYYGSITLETSQDGVINNCYENEFTIEKLAIFIKNYINNSNISYSEYMDGFETLVRKFYPLLFSYNIDLEVMLLHLFDREYRNTQYNISVEKYLNSFQIDFEEALNIIFRLDNKKRFYNQI